jgi:hypothetical protein
MDADIATLNDVTAKQILATVVRAHMRSGVQAPAADPELQHALSDAFAIAPADATVSQGDLARQALALYAEDPDTREAILRLREEYENTSFSVGGVDIALFTLAIVALQTHVRIDRDPKGKWSVHVEKKPLKDNLLVSFVRGVIGLFGKT